MIMKLLSKTEVEKLDPLNGQEVIYRIPCLPIAVINANPWAFKNICPHDDPAGRGGYEPQPVNGLLRATFGGSGGFAADALSECAAHIQVEAVRRLLRHRENCQAALDQSDEACLLLDRPNWLELCRVNPAGRALRAGQPGIK